jgi:hypothetical protein
MSWFSGKWITSEPCGLTQLNLTRMQPDGNSFPPFVLSIPPEAAAAAPAGSYQIPIMLRKNPSLAPFQLTPGRHAPNGARQPNPSALILVKFEEGFFLMASMSDVSDITPQVVLDGPWQLASLRRTLLSSKMLF